MQTHPALVHYLDTLLRYPRGVLGMVILISIAAAAGALRLTIDNDFRVFFSEDNPQLAALDNLDNTFSRDDSVVFVVDAVDGDVFEPRVLALIVELTEASWQLPYSLRVDSLSNYQRSYALEDELVVEPLIPETMLQLSTRDVAGTEPSSYTPVTIRAEDAARVRALAMADPQLLHRYVGPSARATLVAVSGILPQDGGEAAREFVQAGRALQARFQARYPDVRLLLAGGTTTNVVLGEAIGGDFKTLVPLTISVIALGLLLLFRNAVAMALVMALVLLSVTATMGLFGWFGTRMSTVSAFVPSIIMTFAVADAVHVLATFFQQLRSGQAREPALREALRVNAGPVLITSVTTAIGVLSLNFSDSPPYRDLGNMVAVGVFWAYVLTMTVLPALLVLAPRRWLMVGQGSGFWQQQTTALAEFVIRHQQRLLLGGGITVAILAAFVLRNDLTERWFEYFDESFEYRLALDLIDEHIAGIDGIEYVLDSGQPDGINDPAYLATLDAFAQWYRQQPDVVFVSTLADTQKRLNRNMHGDDPAWYRVPESRELAAQYLLLYEFSLAPGQGLEQVIDRDRSATRFSVRSRKMDSSNLLKMEARAAQWLEQNGTGLLPTEGTGLDLMFSHLNARNIRSLLQGAGIALLLISGLLIFALRSVRLGVISLLPNLAPATLSYGLWGMFVGRIDLALSVVVTMSLGIVVDDTVHFMSKYRRARYERGLSAEEGVRHAFNTVGVALMITTAVLVAGFSVLAASHFNPTRETGTLLVMTLALALVVDFLLLPPLLLRFDKHRVGSASD